jgi:CRISPR-associated protein (TIGR03986 family)
MSFDDKTVEDVVQFLQTKGLNALRPRALSEALDILDESGRFLEHEDDFEELAEAAITRMKSGPRHVEKIEIRQSSTGHVGGKHPAKKGGRPAAKQEEKTSPFRFVELNPTVVLAEESVLGGNVLPLPGGFSGTITYTLEAETPLLVGAPSSSLSDEVLPMRLPKKGPWILPGSTVRGWLRSTSEIVSYARLGAVNDDHRFGLRDFFHPDYAQGDSGSSRRLSWESLNAGFLRPATNADPEKQPGDSDFVIETCNKYLVRIRDLPKQCNGGSDTDNSDFHAKWLKRKVESRYSLYETSEGTRFAPVYDFTPAHRFAQSNSRKSDVYAAAQGPLLGLLVFSDVSPSVNRKEFNSDPSKLRAILEQQNHSNELGAHKKRECVFVETENPTVFRLKKDRFEAFHRINSRMSRNTYEPEGVWKALKPTLDSGRRIPVFFTGTPINQDATFELGLTRVFKIGHRYSVKDKISASVPGHIWDRESYRPDMVDALFGYVHEPEQPGSTDPTLARKGRIAFSYAQIEKPDGAETDRRPTKTVSMAPRASYAPFYLKGKTKDWSDPDAKLAGRKRYFPRYDPKGETGPSEAAGAVRKRLEDWSGNGNDKTASNLVFLAPKPGKTLRFTGKIQLDNVTAAELGLVLWCLTHGGDPSKPYRHMLGRAKTAGAGQIRVASVNLNIEANDSGAEALLKSPEPWETGTEGSEGWLAEGSTSMSPFLSAFDEKMRKSVPSWPITPPIQEYLGLSCPAKTASLAGDYLDGPRPYMKLRETAQLHTKYGPPEVPEGDRYLAAPRESTPTLPYRDTDGRVR